MFRKITAVLFLVFSVAISVFSTFKVTSICDTMLQKTDEVSRAVYSTEKDLITSKDSLLDFWSDNQIVISIFTDADTTANIEMTLNKLIFYIEQKNEDDILESAEICKYHLAEIKNTHGFSLMLLL